MIVNIINAFNIIAMLFGVVASLFSMKEGKRPMRLVLFGFAMACFFLSDVYWIIYDAMYPDKAMPFAANEIAEWAFFLLMGAALLADLPKKRVNAVQEIVLAGIFVAGNAGVWILATGEWVQDILTGLTLGYFICCIMARMRYSESFSKTAWRVLAAAALCVLVTQYICMLAKPPYAAYAENVCYAVLFIGIAFLLAASLWEILRGKKADRAVCMSFGLFAWSVIALYLGSNEIVYNTFYVSCSIAVILSLFALRKEVMAQ